MLINKFYNNLVSITASGKIPHTILSAQGAYLTIKGKKKLNFCSSHYLGLATNARLQKAIQTAVKKYGVGTGYRTLAGTHALHLELEEQIANFKETEAAVVFSSAYMANCAAIQTIISKEDIVISDELNHASIIDAVRLSGVKNKFIYKHGDTDDLKKQLEKAEKFRKTPKSNGELPLILIVTDGVFSMDGDLAPLPQIVKLAKKYQALTMVDDAHGEGVLGKGGRGIVNHFGLTGQVDIEVGSLSKAFSCIGGFITGRNTLIEFYKQKSRQRLFSIALTIPDTASALEAIKILQKSEKLVTKLWENTLYLRTQLQKAGFDTGNSETPITPVMLGSEVVAQKFSALLFDANVFATPIVFPMVAKGKARIRVIPSAAHTRKDLNFGVAQFVKAGKKLGVIS